MKPVGYEEGQSYPTILWLHGGPASQFNWGYNDTAQLFAANGYAVIMPNPAALPDTVLNLLTVQSLPGARMITTM